MGAPVTLVKPNPVTGVDELVNLAGGGDASAANQVTGNNSLATIAGKDFATQTTLAALLAATTASLPAGTDRSSSITTGNTAQQLAPSNSTRKSLTGQNISTGDLWVNEIGGTAAIDTAGSFKITAGSAFGIATNRAVSIIGATTGQKFTATET